MEENEKDELDKDFVYDYPDFGDELGYAANRGGTEFDICAQFEYVAKSFNQVLIHIRSKFLK